MPWKFYRKLIPLIALAMCLSSFYCSAETVDFSLATPVQKVSIRIGVLTKWNKETTKNEWDQTAKFLTNNIDGYVFEIIPMDYAEIEKAALSRQVDFVLANPSIYIVLSNKYGVTRIATIKNIGDGSIAYTSKYGGVIFYKSTRSDIKSYKDIKDKKIAAVDINSLGGWHAALAEMLKNSVNPLKDAESVDFLGSHEAVVKAILDDTHDIGIVRTDTLEEMHEQGKVEISEFKILEKKLTDRDEEFKFIKDFPFLISTSLYPEWPLAALPHVSDDLVESVAAYLFEMNPENPACKNADIYGWTVPQNYQSVENLLVELKIPPFDEINKISFEEFFIQHKFEVLVSWILTVIVIIAFLRVRILASHLKTEKAKAEKYFDVASVMLVVLNKEGKVIEINRKGCDLLGYEASELLGKNWFDIIVPKEDIGKVKDVFHSLLSGSKKYFDSAEGRIITKSGDLKTILWTNNVLYDLNGNITGTLSSGQDITIETSIKKADMEATEALKKMNKALVDREIKMSELKRQLHKLDKTKSKNLPDISEEIETLV